MSRDDPKPWTEDHDAQLRTLHEEGLSFALIGDRLGRTRPSCIGRAHRLGISRDGQPKQTASRRTRAPRKPGSLPCGPGANLARRSEFAEALAEHGTVRAAARSLGLSHQRGSQLLAAIRNDIDGPQRAAGFGDWCV